MCYLESKINLNISYGTQLIYVILRRQTKSSHQRFNSMIRTKCNESKKVEARWCPSTLAGAFSPFFFSCDDIFLWNDHHLRRAHNECCDGIVNWFIVERIRLVRACRCALLFLDVGIECSSFGCVISSV